MKKIFGFLLLLFLFSCSRSLPSVTIQTASTVVPVSAEIADNLEEQRVGLMYRTSLEENHGMLFVFSDEQQRIFWMKNTKIPLDIIFIDENGTVVDIKENFQPCVADPCERYTSEPAQYALEVNAGFVEENGVVVGDGVEIYSGNP